METITVKKRVGETFEITLPGRGAVGLSLQFKIDDDRIVSVSKVEKAATEALRPGDSMDITFSVHVKEKGTTNILFYETRLWDIAFSPLPVKKISVSAE